MKNRGIVLSKLLMRQANKYTPWLTPGGIFISLDLFVTVLFHNALNLHLH